MVAICLSFLRYSKLSSIRLLNSVVFKGLIGLPYISIKRRLVNLNAEGMQTG